MWYVPAGTFFPHKTDFQLFVMFLDVCLMIFEERDDDDNNDDDTETPDPVQAQIPSHPGIKYLVRGIPPSDIIHRLSG